LQGLQNLIALREVTYDFVYHQTVWDTDVSVAILSQGKSLFGATAVPIVGGEPIETFEWSNQTNTPLWRAYLSAVRDAAAPQILEQTQAAITQSFVTLRQQDAAVNEESLHLWLTLARLNTLSYGEAATTVDHWNEALDMDAQRRARSQ
jgi:hypothetical protein